MKRAKEEPIRGIRIVDQIWTGTVREFVFGLDDRRIVLSFEQKTGPTSSWTVAVRDRPAGEEEDVVTAVAETRTGALRAAVAAWEERAQHEGRQGLAAIDWGEVERALETVRAL